MNAGEIVIAAVGAIGGVGGAAFAWVQARAAVGSRQDAQAAQAEAEAAQARAEAARDEALELSRKATDAAQRQAEALEEANRLASEALKPGVWQGPRYVNDTTSSWRNVTGRDITIHRTEVRPVEAARLVRLPELRSLPHVIPAGGSLQVMKLRAAGTRPDVLVVEFEIADSLERQSSNLPLS